MPICKHDEILDGWESFEHTNSSHCTKSLEDSPGEKAGGVTAEFFLYDRIP